MTNGLSIQSALRLILDQAYVTEVTETESVDEASGFVLRTDVVADRDLPPFNRSMMDGYAFAMEQIEPGAKLKVVGEIFPGQALEFNLGANEVVRIFTGASVPKNMDTVVQQEWFRVEGDLITLLPGKSFKKGMHIHPQGSDAKKGETLIKSGTLLNSRHLPTLLSVGHTEVKVSTRINISIVTTGNEVIKPDSLPESSQIRDANLVTLKEMCKPWAENIELFGQVPDDKLALKEVLKKALFSHVVLVSAGVSAGDHDFVPEVLAELGVEKIFHKIDLKPGHPLWFGKKDKTLVFGLPGNPVSGQVCFKLLVEPLLKKLLGMENTEPVLYKLPLLDAFSKKHVRHEWAMGVLQETAEGSKVVALKNTGSGDFFHYGKSIGLISLPGKDRVFLPGEYVEWLPL